MVQTIKEKGQLREAEQTDTDVSTIEDNKALRQPMTHFTYL